MGDTPGLSLTPPCLSTGQAGLKHWPSALKQQTHLLKQYYGSTESCPGDRATTCAFRKSQFMVFTHSKSAKFSFSFDGQVLEPLKDVKWLGIWFDDKLAFGKQHTQVRKKADDTLAN
jgi:hypothetical protein